MPQACTYLLLIFFNNSFNNDIISLQISRYIQGVTNTTDFWNNFCSNENLKFFFLYIIYSHLRNIYIIQKTIFIF